MKPSARINLLFSVVPALPGLGASAADTANLGFFEAKVRPRLEHRCIKAYWERSVPAILTFALSSVYVAIGNGRLKVWVTVALLAYNTAFVLLALFDLLVFLNANKYYTAWNYYGLFVAEIACMGSLVVGSSLTTVRVVFRGERILWHSLVRGLSLGVSKSLSFYFLLQALQSTGQIATFVFPIFNILFMLGASAAGWLILWERLQALSRFEPALAAGAIPLISYQGIGSLFAP